MRKFTNYRADILRTHQIVKDGSLLKNEEKIFENIPIALWKSSKNFGNTELAVQTTKNSYEINLEAQYNNIKITDKISIKNLGNFVVEQVILHHNHCGKLDNVQVFVTEII